MIQNIMPDQVQVFENLAAAAALLALIIGNYNNIRSTFAVFILVGIMPLAYYSDYRLIIWPIFPLRMARRIVTCWNRFVMLWIIFAAA